MTDKALTISRGREFRPHPRLVKVTPAFAEKILENNRLNRPLRSGRVERYARDMVAGRWRSNGETIKMTEDGDLLDGQHRLFAVIEANVTIEMLFVEGLDPEVMPTIDTGAARGFADVLAIKGGKNNLVVASVYRWMYWYNQHPRQGRSLSMSITHSELMPVAEKNKDVAARAAEVASAKAKKLMPAAILCFVYTLAYRADAAKAGAWLELLGSGANLDEKHPVYQLRERMLANRGAKAKLPPTDICALAIKSWNQFITGKRTNVLSWRSTEPFPEFAKTK